MNANPQFLSQNAEVDQAAIKPLPNSRKVYVEGSRSDIRVPMREITQSETPSSFGAEKNPPIFVYDTSGPYTDPDVKIDIRSGLPSVRDAWIAERNDTDELDGPTSTFGQERLVDPQLAEMRFNLTRKPRRAKPSMNESSGLGGIISSVSIIVSMEIMGYNRAAFSFSGRQSRREFKKS